MTAKGGIAIAYCHPGHVDGWFMESVLRVFQADSMRKPKTYGGNKVVPGSGPRLLQGAGGYLHVETGPRIASARNQLVRRFLEKFTCEWLWMLDTDMRFDPSVLDTLAEHADPQKVPIIGGLCFTGGRSDVMYPTLYRIVDPSENNGNAVVRLMHYPENALVQVDATGAACLLMHRSALEKMATEYPEPAPWFMETIFKGEEFGEDWTFCLRAGRLGIPIYVHTGAVVGHMKRFCITDQTYKDWLSTHEVEAV